MVTTARPSLRRLADELGCTHQGLAKAAREGRLTAGVRVEEDRVVLVDAEAAAAQWRAGSVARAGAEPTDANAAYLAARARRESALADMAEIDVAEKRGELVSVDEAESHWANVVTMIKTKILGVPSRLAQRMPRIASDVVPILESMLREALEEIADVNGDDLDE